MTRDDDDPNGNAQREPSAGEASIATTKRVQSGTQVLAKLLLDLLLELEGEGRAEHRRAVRHIHEIHSAALMNILRRGRP